jgi:hypothetical protein
MLMIMILGVFAEFACDGGFKVAATHGSLFIWTGWDGLGGRLTGVALLEGRLTPIVCKTQNWRLSGGWQIRLQSQHESQNPENPRNSAFGGNREKVGLHPRMTRWPIRNPVAMLSCQLGLLHSRCARFRAHSPIETYNPVPFVAPGFSL